jgi:vacuolar-type H+-ATPase subunit H
MAAPSAPPTTNKDDSINGRMDRWAFAPRAQHNTDYSQLKYPGKEDVMRKALILVTTAAMLAGTAMTGSAIARDRSDRTELTASQISDQASARAAQMKADLRLTAEQQKNWPAFETAVVDMWKKQTEQQIAWRNAHAKEQGSVDLIDEMRKDADQQVDEANARKKLADAAQPLYGSLDEQQKHRFSEILFRKDRDRRSY